MNHVFDFSNAAAEISNERLKEKFPDLIPLKKPPRLSPLNVWNLLTCCGFSFVGKRDFDPETRTYVTTLVFFCAVPLSSRRLFESATPGRGFSSDRSLCPAWRRVGTFWCSY
ncbi:MAG TPA: hypothetical protein VKE98_16565 [Gemmataceae bacterium]|nr:hypothetical protein [Gemmataceae bacterium]